MEPSSRGYPMELQTKAFQVLSSNDNTAMETLFTHLYSSQHQYRSQAFSFLQCCKRHYPDLLFIKLYFILTSSPNPQSRTNAARALHFVNPQHLWPKLKPLAQVHLKAHFLTYFSQEPSIDVLRHASHVLAQTISVAYKTHQHWPEILDFLLASLSAHDDKSREVASLVFAKLPKDCRFLVSNALRKKRNAARTLQSSFLILLASSNPDLQIAAFGAVVSLVRLFSEPSLFHDLLRALIVAVFMLLHGFEGSYFRKAFAELINLVSQEPILLSPYMNDMVLDVVQIAEGNRLRHETRRLAFELVITMTEVTEYKHVFAILPLATVRRLLLVPVKMLRCVANDGGLEQKDVDVYDFGLKCLKKVCLALGASKVVPAAFEVLGIQLDDKEWKVQHAGIIMLTVIAEEFSDEMVMMGNLGEVVSKVLKLIQDSHVQVRLAILKFMANSTNVVQAVQLLYHQRLVHAFCMALDKDQNHKVKEQAASALLSFLKNTLPESLTLNTNVDTLMGKLLSLLQGKESDKQRSTALLSLNIVTQRCHEVAQKYCVVYLPILLEACHDKNSEIKEEAVRGIRICAELGTPQLKPFINRIRQALSVLMKDPNRLLSENAKVHDIAVSVVGRICEFYRECIDGSKLVPAWLCSLPLKNDLVEAKVMHEQLCSMVARLDKDILGPENQNIAKIILVFLEIIENGDKLATAHIIKQLPNLLKHLTRRIPRSAFDTIIFSLNAQQQELLLSFLS